MGPELEPPPPLFFDVPHPLVTAINAKMANLHRMA
jgi:hypothetical protein